MYDINIVDKKTL